MITEVKPKNWKYEIMEAELNILGYIATSRNLKNKIGRGMLTYIRESLNPREIHMKTEYEESVWNAIKINSKDELLVGTIYRSPNSEKEENKLLCTLMKEVDRCGYSHLLITGDFNYPTINWNNWTTPGEREDGQEFLFVECLREMYVYQHVNEPTRGRGSDEPHILDLILTNEEGHDWKHSF